jgi:macrolide transport system ATP-binding/permease protein
MPMLREWINRLRLLGNRDDFDREIRKEIEFHIEARAAELQEDGLARKDALRLAKREFGSTDVAREDSRGAWQFQWLEEFLTDLRIGLRMLARSPGFSILAILCLTLGIGANAVVFSWAEGLLFRPYPAVAHQEWLMALTGTARGESDPTALSWPDYQDLERNCTRFDAFFVSKITSTTLSIGDRAERTVGSIVSANYFDAIGVRPILGRGFVAVEDEGRNAHPVMVISHQFWQQRYKGDPEIVGKTQRLNGVVHTIIGVAPEGFYGTFVGWKMQFWVPVSMEEIFEPGGYKLEDRGARWIESYVRRKPGITGEQAQEEISAVAGRLEAQYPLTNRGRSVKLWPLWQTPFNGAGTLLPTLEIMLAVVVCVLLIVCANVGNLLLIHSAARHHEMLVRAAIGAGRKRLLKQLLTEGFALSLLGAVGGLAVAYWFRQALVLLFPSRSGASLYFPGEMDWRVLALTAGVCAAATILIGLLPAIQTSRIDLAAALKSEMAGLVGGYGKSWMRSSLVVVQVAVSFLLLVGSGLLLQSLRKIRTTSPGFLTHRVMTTGIDLASAGYDEKRARNFQDELLERVLALPGVESAAFARVTPLGVVPYSESPIAVDGYQVPPEEQPTVEYNEVGADYFATMGIPIITGREFTRADDQNAELVALVNETMAAKFWNGKYAVGERVRVKDNWRRVVGVVKNSKYEDMREERKPFFYVPLRQAPSMRGSLNIRTLLSPQAIASALAREVRALDGNLAMNELITLQEQVDRSTSPQKAALILLEVLGSVAVLLAGVGIYGVVSYAVSQNSRELGLRMALGARAPDLVHVVISHCLLLIAGGIALGMAAALVSSRLLGVYLYHVSPCDPLAFGSATIMMVMLALMASLIPAWRAVHIDPARALREG